MNFQKVGASPEKLSKNCIVLKMVNHGNWFITDKTSQETPNTQTATFKCRDGKMLEFETRGRYTSHEGSGGQEVGNIFYGTEGCLEISGSTWKAFREREREPFAGSQEGGSSRGGNLYRNA
jgi:hypothetical protein